MPEITVWMILVAALGVVIGYVSFKALETKMPKGGLSFAGRLLASVAIFTIVLAAGIPEVREYLGIEKPAPAVGVVPVEQITVGRIGLVLAIAEDKLAVPRTLIEGADIYVSTTQPVPRAAWTAVATDTTDASGSAVVEVRGLTSGQVYVTGWIDGYYSDFTTAIIPGPEVLPTVPASLKLEAITNNWSVTVTDESASITFDDPVTTITLDTATALSGYFTLNITTIDAFTALKNIRMLEIRGDDFGTLNAALVPTVLNNGGTVPAATGDPTLSTSVVGGYDFSGSLVYGQVIQIRVLVSSDLGAGSIARISLDDLLGSTGYLNEPGVDELILYIEAI